MVKLTEKKHQSLHIFFFHFLSNVQLLVYNENIQKVPIKYVHLYIYIYMYMYMYMY